MQNAEHLRLITFNHSQVKCWYTRITYLFWMNPSLWPHLPRVGIMVCRRLSPVTALGNNLRQMFSYASLLGAGFAHTFRVEQMASLKKCWRWFEGSRWPSLKQNRFTLIIVCLYSISNFGIIFWIRLQSRGKWKGMICTTNV